MPPIQLSLPYPPASSLYKRSQAVQNHLMTGQNLQEQPRKWETLSAPVLEVIGTVPMQFLVLHC